MDAVARRLPSPADLERRSMALATLDALLSPDWEYRYYSFNRRWDPERGSRMASMRNGSGDDYFILFFADGSAALKGLDHESSALRGQRSVAGVLDGIPSAFADFVGEPAFSAQSTTFCLWNEGDGWRRSETLSPAVLEEDGSEELLAMLVGSARDYADFARDYFEVDVREEIVARFFALEPLRP